MEAQLGLSGYHAVCMSFHCYFPLGPEKQLLVPVLSYVSAGCKAGRLHEALVRTAESQLRLLVHGTHFICLNVRSFSWEAQWALLPMFALSYVLSRPQQIRTTPKQPRWLRNCPLVLQ